MGSDLVHKLSSFGLVSHLCRYLYKCIRSLYHWSLSELILPKRLRYKSKALVSTLSWSINAADTSWQNILYSVNSEIGYGVIINKNGVHLICSLQQTVYDIMTSSNRNIFRVIGPLCDEITGNQWILRTKASDVELRCFIWSAPE